MLTWKESSLERFYYESVRPRIPSAIRKHTSPPLRRAAMREAVPGVICELGPTAARALNWRLRRVLAGADGQTGLEIEELAALGPEENGAASWVRQYVSSSRGDEVSGPGAMAGQGELRLAAMIAQGRIAPGEAKPFVNLATLALKGLHDSLSADDLATIGLTGREVDFPRLFPRLNPELMDELAEFGPAARPSAPELKTGLASAVGEIRVGAKDALRQVEKVKRLCRQERQGRHLYRAPDRARRQEQWAARQARRPGDDAAAAKVLFQPA